RPRRGREARRLGVEEDRLRRGRARRRQQARQGRGARDPGPRCRWLPSPVGGQPDRRRRRVTSPDPIHQARAYQQSLLDALGADDPAEAQASTPARIRRLIADAGTDLWTRPEPKEWSVIECIGHVVDAEIVMSGRYRWIVAHDQPELIGYDQDL